MSACLLGEERSHLEPGHRLDRYELLCPIAHGGMASVWLARQHGKHGFEKLVAIKTILPQYASDLRFQQMFLEEARITSGIEHANVAQILDLGESRGVLYLVMEWVDGDSLSKLHRAVERRNQKIPLGVALRIIADTSAGLHAAHERRDRFGHALGVVHRDVSPQNILVSVKGNAKLIDFGIAKAENRTTADTNAGLLKGKIQYMAPEQAMGQTIDRRADVWALGAVLYYVLSGAPPYDGANQLATLNLLTSGDPPPPLPSHYPPEVNALCMQALAFDEERRLATAADMQLAIERLMVQTGVFTTTADVAKFVGEHLAERTEARRKAVQLALDASVERHRLSVRKPPTEVPVIALGEPDLPVSQATLGSAVLEYRSEARKPHGARALWAIPIGIIGTALVVASSAAFSAYMGTKTAAAPSGRTVAAAAVDASEPAEAVVTPPPPDRIRDAF